MWNVYIKMVFKNNQLELILCLGFHGTSFHSGVAGGIRKAKANATNTRNKIYSHITNNTVSKITRGNVYF